jgi:ornithine cyclodeaminase/alanine dehydrogenase-like protein (mu-crystallin family)
VAEHQILYLSRQDVEQAGMGMGTVIAIVEAAYREKSQGQVQMPPKLGVHPQANAFIHAMPAFLPGLESAGIKWVSAYAGNTARGLPQIAGLIILNEPETGIPYAVLDATWITAQRTGAKTAIAAKHLAHPGSETAGILACGLQGRTNLIALAEVFPLKKVYAYDINHEAQARYVAEMQARFPFQIVGVSEPQEAVVESDLVVTSGPILAQPQPTIPADWLKPGGFGSAVDYDSYWSGAALKQMDRIYTDDIPQFQSQRQAGYFQQTPEPYADLGELVGGQKAGRQRADERLLAMCLGSAMDDMAVAPEVVRRARQQGLGVLLDL